MNRYDIVTVVNVIGSGMEILIVFVIVIEYFLLVFYREYRNRNTDVVPNFYETIFSLNGFPYELDLYFTEFRLVDIPLVFYLIDLDVSSDERRNFISLTFFWIND